MTNLINKKCPQCGHPESDILGVIIRGRSCKKGGGKQFLNHYQCLKCKQIFEVIRKGNKTEQELTEKYIKSKFIKLE